MARWRASIKQKAPEIVAGFDIPIEGETPDVEDLDEAVVAWLRVYSPVFDEKAPKWRFLYEEKPIFADITETTIARDAMRRGGAFTNDLYKVRMTVKTHLTPTGQENHEYKIIEVLSFSPAQTQVSLPLHPPPDRTT